ncbi:hypothetical protein EDB85DRAFT_1304407 [Lactarius pseudohatsudake]|nr:hypothetical protein EDB85DRAFT_1304407 [Lactarius pseudohatsudake]
MHWRHRDSACLNKHSMNRDLGRISSNLLPIFVRGEPYFPYGAGNDANQQTHKHAGSRVGSVHSLRHVGRSPTHLPLCALCLLPAGPIFTRLGSGHRQYRPHVASRGHPYGFGCWGHLEAQVVIYWNLESDIYGTIRLSRGTKEWADVACSLFARHDSWCSARLAGRISPHSHYAHTHTHIPSFVISLITSHRHGLPSLVFAPKTASRAFADKPRIPVPRAVSVYRHSVHIA